MKTLDLTPTPEGFRRVLTLIAKHSEDQRDRDWARSQIYTPKRCQECGLKIRKSVKNHIAGIHHRRKVKK